VQELLTLAAALFRHCFLVK